MAKVSDFTSNLSALPGVAGYLLTNKNGQIIAHNLPNHNFYMPWAQQMINRCILLSHSLNNEELCGVSLKQEDGKLIHIFPVKQYQLVVLQSEDIINDHLFQQIAALIHDTVEQG